MKTNSERNICSLDDADFKVQFRQVGTDSSPLLPGSFSLFDYIRSYLLDSLVEVIFVSGWVLLCCTPLMHFQGFEPALNGPLRGDFSH